MGMMVHTKRRYEMLALAAIVVVLAIALSAWIAPADDALITHRYVANFLGTGRPYFNSTDKIYGFTSMGYFILLSVVAKAVGIQIAYLGIAAIAYLFTFFAMIYVLGIDRSAHKFLWLMLFAANVHMAYWYFSGMETYFVVVFGILSLIALKRRSFALLTVSLTVGVFFRPEVLIMSGLISLIYVFIHWRSLRLKAVIFALILGAILSSPYIAYTVFYFENIIPLSISAKASVPINSDSVQRAYMLIREGYASFFTSPLPKGGLLAVGGATIATLLVNLHALRRTGWGIVHIVTATSIV